MFWGQGPNAIHRCWNFVTSLRCADPWYNKFLEQCRHGRLSNDLYNLLHGFPSAAPVSLSDATFDVPAQAEKAQCTCAPDVDAPAGGQYDVDLFYKPWVKRFMEYGETPEELIALECPACAAKRKERRRVLSDEVEWKEQLLFKPFDAAPSLYAYNVPRYCAIMLRARTFAKARAHGAIEAYFVARDFH